MNSIKNIILILLFLLCYHSAKSDCGHCFTLAKVKILYNNGSAETTYFEFFRGYVIENGGIDPKENESIINYLPQNRDTIQVVDTFYQLENLPAFMNIENKRKIAIKDIKDIYLLEWTTIGGAMELPHLPVESIDRIINSDTFFVGTKIFSVHDENYIYTGTELSLDEFNVLINESYNDTDMEPSLLRHPDIDLRNNIYPGKVEIINAFDDFFIEMDSIISFTSKIKINKEIDEYFHIYNTNLKKQKRYLELVFDYLNTSVSEDLELFISDSIEGEYHKNSLLKEINKEKDTIKNTIALVSKLYILKEDHLLNEEFNKVIKTENIIVLVVSWD